MAFHSTRLFHTLAGNFALAHIMSRFDRFYIEWILGEAQKRGARSRPKAKFRIREVRRGGRSGGNGGAKEGRSSWHSLACTLLRACLPRHPVTVVWLKDSGQAVTCLDCKYRRGNILGGCAKTKTRVTSVWCTPPYEKRRLIDFHRDSRLFHFPTASKFSAACINSSENRGSIGHVILVVAFGRSVGPSEAASSL